MSQVSGKNPFRPGAGVAPTFLAGRDGVLRRVARILDAAPELPANIRMSGLRGVGKTVLLKEIDAQSEAQGWLTARIQIEPRDNTEDGLAQVVRRASASSVQRSSRIERLKAKTEGLATAARQMVTLSYEDIHFSIGGMAGPTAGIAEAVLEASQAAANTGRAGFLLMLDEAQLIRDDRSGSGEHPLSMLIAAINTLQEQQVPVGLILCGLPTLKPNLLKARTYSERMFRGEDIGELTDYNDAAQAFNRPLEATNITATNDLVDRVIAEVEGYPYFIQVWGAEMWDTARYANTTTLTVELLESIEPDIYRRLDADFYAPRVESLTPAEQDLIVATGECSYPPVHTSEVRQHTDKSDGNINVLMGRLVDQGVLFRRTKGQYEYTAPKFADYLQRRAGR